jgi:hypothetical protein
VNRASLLRRIVALEASLPPPPPLGQLVLRVATGEQLEQLEAELVAGRFELWDALVASYEAGELAS